MVSRQTIRQVLAGLLAIAITVFYVLVVVGCSSTSPGVPGLYLVKLANNETKAEVHIGLFSLCAGAGSNLTCAGTLGQAANRSATSYVLPGTTTAASTALQPLLALAAGIQSSNTGPGGVLSIVYVPLLLSALCFAAALSSRVAARALARRGAAAEKIDDDGGSASSSSSRSLALACHARRAAALLTTGATMAVLAAAIASTVAVRALLFAGTVLPGTAASAAAKKSTTAVVVTGGTSLQVLEWLLVVLTLLWHPILEPAWRKVL